MFRQLVELVVGHLHRGAHTHTRTVQNFPAQQHVAQNSRPARSPPRPAHSPCARRPTWPSPSVSTIRIISSTSSSVMSSPMQMST